MAWQLGEAGPPLKISVILPTFQAAAYWPAWLEAMQQQTLSAELVVVDSSSTDGTADLARAAGARVAVIPQTSFDHGASRNLGASLASGEVLVFMTQDARPAHPEFLAQLVAPLAQPMPGPVLPSGSTACSTIPRRTTGYRHPTWSGWVSGHTFSPMWLRPFPARFLSGRVGLPRA